MRILTSEQMANIDRRAIEDFGIPSIVLMENAASAVADVIERHFSEAEAVALFCGTGNNGGDGFAVARHLRNRGVEPRIFLLGDRGRLEGDAKTNFDICLKMEIDVDDVTTEEELLESLAHASECDVVVDALFGTGLNRPAEGLHAEAIRSLCDLRLPIVAIDIPSGLNGSSRLVNEPVVEADVTVTFAQPKIPHIFPPASFHCGEVIVADISIPEEAIEAEGANLSLITPDDVERFVQPRALDTHKGTYGHVVIVAGSPGKSGAAILAARGAVRGGAGLATVVTDGETASTIDAAAIESMTLRVEREERSIPSIVRFLDQKSAVLIGPGLPDDEDGYAFIRKLVSRVTLPLVLDATAVNAFAGQIENINRERRSVVLTPHPGELARLLGVRNEEVVDDRLAIVRKAAASSGCIVVLKGHQTLIASPDGRIAVNPTGNPGMASGGVGDVLAGLIVAYAGQGTDLFAISCAAVYIHGLAGDIVRENRGDIGMTAMDIANALPDAVLRIRTGQ